MARYIDADVLQEEIQGAIFIKNPLYMDAPEALAIIDMQPTADVAEVVRCKDCRYSKVSDNGRFRKKIYCFQPAPIKQIVETEENRFCSYGEKEQ